MIIPEYTPEALAPTESANSPAPAPAQETPQAVPPADAQSEAVDAIDVARAAIGEHGADVDQLATRSINAGNLDAIPEPVREHASAALAVYQQQADAHVSSLGAEPDAFYTWAKANHAEELNRAAVQHWHTRDATVYGALVQRYLSTVPPDAATLKAGGITTTITRHGETLVTIGGLTMSAKAAARAGLI